MDGRGGCALKVIMDELSQLSKPFWQKINSGEWNFKQDYCRSLFGALFGCVFGIIGGGAVKMLLGELVGFSYAELGLWVRQKLERAGFTYLAGKWGLALLKSGCDQDNTPLNPSDLTDD